MTTILLLCFGAALISLPFGIWRTRTRRLSLRWFLAIHLPVPFIFVMRRLAGVGWEAIPLFIASSIGGQVAGGRIGVMYAARQMPEQVRADEEI